MSSFQILKWGVSFWLSQEELEKNMAGIKSHYHSAYSREWPLGKLLSEEYHEASCTEVFYPAVNLVHWRIKIKWLLSSYMGPARESLSKYTLL